MAIDSALKRRSAAGLTVGRGVTPDAAAGAAWRQAVAWSYAGILAGEAVVTVASLVCGSISIGPAVAGAVTVDPAVAATASIREC